MMSWLSKSMPTRLRTSAPSSRTLLFVAGGVLLAGGATYVYKKYTRGDCDDASHEGLNLILSPNECNERTDQLVDAAEVPRVHDAHHAVGVVVHAAEVVDKAIAEAAGEVENISDISDLSDLSDSTSTSEGKREDGTLSTPTVESLPGPSAGPINPTSAMEPLPLPSPLELLRLPVGEAPVAMIPSMATLVEATASSSDNSVADITPKCRCVVITGRKLSNVQRKLFELLDELAVVVKVLNRQADKDACSRYEAMMEGKLYPKVFMEDAATGLNCQAIKRDDLLNLIRFCRFTEQHYDWELVPPAQRARLVFQDAMARLSAGTE